MKKITKFIGLLLFAILVTSCAASKTSESTGEYLDNAAITARVKSKLFQEQSLASLNIRVKAYKGTIQLSGFVNNKNQVQTAEQIALHTANVKKVVNNLIVKS